MLPKKSLGQHFLHSTYYLGLMADAANVSQSDYIVEIGPGEGALTQVLLTRGATVVALEKDRRLIPVLQEKFAKEIKNKKLFLYEADALHFDISKCLPKAQQYKVVANIPYYITGALLQKFLTAHTQPRTLVFLIQKEVAERITGHPSTSLRVTKESILSLSVKVYGTPAYIKTVPKGAFSPPPTVDSAILRVEHISRANFTRSTSQRANSEFEKRFFELVKVGFAQKRKLLKRNVEKILGTHVQEAFAKAGIAENARAEDVPLEQWLMLSDK
ncbi:MAG: 16S rRNA (adenine(1518)-N(6)/adenine(1519)-N(6))-dimethyltransferase RsmA [Minisyncoccia bacterium]|jgi:16S rRNA (adenine1518-N6/adenine1519-N6)-dimethyltransferase